MDLAAANGVKALRLAGALALGLLLFALPFLRYSPWAHGGEAHMNHEPRHGGQLGMVGDHHIEVSRRGSLIEVFVSDPWRQPLEATRGSVVFDNGEPVPLIWQRYRLVGPDQAARDLEVTAVLANGEELTTEFDYSDPDP